MPLVFCVLKAMCFKHHVYCMNDYHGNLTCTISRARVKIGRGRLWRLDLHWKQHVVLLNCKKTEKHVVLISFLQAGGGSFWGWRKKISRLTNARHDPSPPTKLIQYLPCPRHETFPLECCINDLTEAYYYCLSVCLTCLYNCASAVRFPVIKDGRQH